MATRARDLLMRAPVGKPGQDWFRIENKKSDTETEDKTDIYIYDEIGFWGTSASEFVRQVAAIASPKIDLHLNSPGGEIFDGIAIYNSLKSHHAEVTVYVDSLAASAASFIAQAGDKILMNRNATMMIHDGLGFTYGNAKDHQDTGALLDKLSNNIADIYSQRAGGDVETWRNYMREEVWYNAQEAVDAGLADEVVEAEAAPSADNFSLLTFFNYAGRSNAPSPEELRTRVFNRVKEARMATQPRNEVTQPEGVNPEGENTDSEETEANSPDGSQPGESGTVPEVPVPVTPAPAPENKAPQFSGVLVNGVKVTDLTAIQNHINVLEATINETRDSNRKAFVTDLASSGRIAATQLEKTTEFALDLSDKQYETWVASWDAAPSLQLLGDHAASGQYGAGATGAVRAENDNLETSKAIVNQHKLGGMPVDKIKETPSYKAIVAHDPEFKL